jgi:hypothetical protein
MLVVECNLMVIALIVSASVSLLCCHIPPKVLDVTALVPVEFSRDLDNPGYPSNTGGG